MADETASAEVLRERSAPAPPTPISPPSRSFYDLALGLMSPSTALTERRATRLETGATEAEREAKAIADLAREQAAAREAARPAKPDLTPPPSTGARAFLEPGPSVLNQLQVAMQGIGQIALGMAGAKGTGYAIAATAGLKGALEGWQTGDAERVKRGLAEWSAQRQHLMDEYQLNRDAFNDLLTNQKLAMSERFAQIELRARILGMQDLADAARQQNLDLMFKVFQGLDQSQLEHEKAAATLAHWQAQAAQAERSFRGTQAHRAETERVAREGLELRTRRTKIYEETAGGILKLQTQDQSLGNKINTARIVEEAVKVLADRNLLATGPTTPDAWRAAIQRGTAWGDPQVKWAVDVVERLGTALVVGSEIALGEPASAMRLKAVLEPQAGHILTASPAFWKTFFERYKPFLQEQRTTVREHLRQLDRLPREFPEDVILETTP